MTISKLYLFRKINESNEFYLLPLTNSEKVSNPNSLLYSLLPAPLPLVQSPNFSQESDETAINKLGGWVNI